MPSLVVIKHSENKIVMQSGLFEDKIVGCKNDKSTMRRSLTMFGPLIVVWNYCKALFFRALDCSSPGRPSFSKYAIILYLECSIERQLKE